MMKPGPPTAEQSKKYLDGYYEWLLNMEKPVTNNEQLKSDTFTKIELENLESLKRTAQLLMQEISIPVYDNKMVVAGGCFASWLDHENCKDIDVFYLNLNDLDRKDVIYILKSRYSDLHETTHSYNRGNPKITHVFNSHKSKYQFIFTTNNTREELIKDFDYVHTMVSYHNDTLYLTRKTYDAIRKKQLIVNNGKNIQAWRRTKFLSRGWTCPDIDAMGEMSEDDFNAIMRQPANAGNWQSAARINPMRGAKSGSAPAFRHSDKLTEYHLNKLLEDLEKNGL